MVVNQEGYAVVNIKDLTLVDSGAQAASEAEALDKMKELIAADPKRAAMIQVVPTFEVNRG
jgi:hypothetical protein